MLADHGVSGSRRAPSRNRATAWLNGRQGHTTTGLDMPNSIANSIAALAETIASTLGPRAMRLVAHFNKYVTNPVQRLWASRVPYMAVIEHTGRKSGRSYRTPVMAFIGDGAMTVVPNYGKYSDWVRNVQAAGSAEVVHRGTRYQLTAPQIVAAEPGRHARLTANVRN